MNSDNRPRRGDGHLPAEELLPEIPFVAEIDAHHRMAVGLERRHLSVGLVTLVAFQSQVDEETIRAVLLRRRHSFIGNRDDSFAIFAGAFGDQLLDPRRKRGERTRAEKRHLVFFRQSEFA